MPFVNEEINQLEFADLLMLDKNSPASQQA